MTGRSALAAALPRIFAGSAGVPRGIPGPYVSAPTDSSRCCSWFCGSSALGLLAALLLLRLARGLLAAQLHAEQVIVPPTTTRPLQRVACSAKTQSQRTATSAMIPTVMASAPAIHCSARARACTSETAGAP